MLLPLLNTSLVKYALVALAVASLLGLGYRTAYNHGKLAAEATYQAETEQFIKQIHARISQVEQNLDKALDLAIFHQERLTKDIDEILKRVKSKPVAIIKNNKCVPSETFVEGINQAIRRANEQ